MKFHRIGILRLRNLCGGGGLAALHILPSRSLKKPIDKTILQHFTPANMAPFLKQFFESLIGMVSHKFLGRSLTNYNNSQLLIKLKNLQGVLQRKGLKIVPVVKFDLWTIQHKKESLDNYFKKVVCIQKMHN